MREVADRSKQRGNMLAQVCAAYRKVSDAKQQLQEAEHELQQALKSAEAYLQVCRAVRDVSNGCILRCMLWATAALLKEVLLAA